MKVTFFLFIVGCLQAAEYSFSLPWKFVWFIGRFKSQVWRMLCSGWRVYHMVLIQKIRNVTAWVNSTEFSWLICKNVLCRSTANPEIKETLKVAPSNGCKRERLLLPNCFVFLVGSPPKMETLFLSWPWHQSVWFCEYIFFFSPIFCLFLYI